MKKALIVWVWLALLVSSFMPGLAVQAQDVQAVTVSPAVSAEGHDYATETLGNAWDMNEYADISKYLNTSGVLINLNNIEVADGVFSARSANTDPYFFSLFPGYGAEGINPGGYGVNYPIDSSKYHCLTMRARATGGGAIHVLWFADQMLTSSEWGASNGIAIPSTQWTIYSLDLNTAFNPQVGGNTAWNGRSSWQGLRIDPTNAANVDFAIDWIRITDCSPRNITVSWSPTGDPAEIWMGRSQGSLETRLKTVSSGSTTTLDVQGWEAGDYWLGVRNMGTGSVEWRTFTIEAQPKLTFLKPSFTSGEGIVWNMNNPSEVFSPPGYNPCMDMTMSGGMLDMYTRPPSSIGSNCRAGAYSNPNLFLTLPAPEINLAEYPYITYNLYMDGAWQDVNKGWVFRWLWYYRKPGSPSVWCIGVSHDIILDVGWQRVALDMSDPKFGVPEYVDYEGGTCSQTTPWSANSIFYLRFDPNENDTSTTFFQKLDSVHLNKVDRSPRGTTFPVYFNPSKNLNDLELVFYYTTDPGQPRQHFMQEYVRPGGSFDPGAQHLFLPGIQRSGGELPSEGVRFSWDTRSVTPGRYYVCAESTDSVGNTGVDCSEAPVDIY